MTNLRLARLGLQVLLMLGLVLCLPFGMSEASAQTTNGRFVITVKDETGAVVPGATVTVVNQGTLQEVTGTTGENGVYTTQLLPIGFYKVTIEAAGFKKFVSEGLKLDVGQEYGYSASLQVGGADDIVVVSAGGEALVNTTTGEIRNTVSAKQTQELPLPTRNPLNLIQLQAGVNGNLTRGFTTINGQRQSTIQVTKDGINIQDNFIRANAADFSPNSPTVAGVGEVTIVTQNAGADVAGSAAIRFVTPSGTNEYHGEVFEFHRNRVLNANDFFNNAVKPRIERPPFIRNQFGYRIGGPIFKNKLFFFNALEGTKQVTGSQLTTTVLLPNARRGIFTYRDNSGQIRTLNLLSARNFSIDPFIAGLIARIPSESNIRTVGDQLNTSGLLIQKTVRNSSYTSTTRIDYIINSNHSVNGVYEYNRRSDDRPDIDTSFNKRPLVVSQGSTHFVKGGWNWAVNNRLSNEVIVGHNFTNPVFISSEDRSAGFFVTGLPTTNPVVTFLNQGRTTRLTSFIDRAQLSVGAHNISFGAQYDRIRVTPFNDAGIIPNLGLGQATFPSGFALRGSDFPGGIDATQLLTANNFLAFYSGSIASASVTYNAVNQTSGFVRGATQKRNLEIDQYSWYVTDQWRFHPRLTINAGLRYDYVTPLRERDNFVLLPERGNATTGKAIVLNPNGVVNFARGKLFNSDFNNFAPNISVAWDIPGLGRQTVLRGGYSFAYVNDEAVRAVDNSALTNAGLQQTRTATLAELQALGSPRVSTSAAAVIAGPLAPPQFRIPITFAQQFAINAQSAFGTPDPNLQTPNYQQYNIGIERELTKDMVFTVRYVGNRSTNLIRGIDYNQIDVIGTGFAADVRRAQQNGFLALRATGVFDPRFNPNIPGSQQLTVFPLLTAGGLLTNPTIRSFIQTGEAGQLALIYIINRLTGSVRFSPNPNALAANVLENFGRSNYNALQVEVRRRFADSKIGSYFFQANYTFGKVLGNIEGFNSNGNGGATQTRFDALLDNNRPELEYARASFDVRHQFKANFLYELPFGPGKTFNSDNKIIQKLIGGYQLSGIFEMQSGFPFSFISGRGTFNRVGRGINTANTSLTVEQIKKLFGIRKTPNGIFYIDPKVIGPDGRAVAPDGAPPFAGQIFFNPGPGEVGSLQKLQFDGPRLHNFSLSIMKRTPITERINTEFRAEMFNVFNRPVFFFSDQNINSTTFGQITSTFNSPRIIQLALKVSF
ncbi:MAG: TonB-dependent receptor [Acidobacteriota bacterium]|nr:TonB-dependent receptor [Blastocatellia bacterium]MDW8412206.1 TonB-dependent receptor [Acidobacteriota bacterium]